MKKLLCLLLSFLLAALPICSAEIDLFATPAPDIHGYEALPELSLAPLEEAPPLQTDCAALLLMEPESGQIICEMNADTRRPVASVTKIMTILLTLEAIRQERISLDTRCVISPQAAGMGGSQVLLDVGEVQTVDVLLKSVIVGSANDACVALAELLYGSEALCVEKMNARAAQLGMENSRFVNCTGLPAEGQYTTARDVARMTMAMLSHELYFDYSTIWLDEVDHGDGRVTQLTNTNKLTRLCEGCDGGKTGYTDAAGRCISATAKRGELRLIAVVLGAGSSSDRFDIAAGLLDYGFANYRLYPVARRGTRVRGGLPVENGRPDSVQLMLDGGLTLLTEKGGEQEIRLIPELPESLRAPVQIGDPVGHVRVEKNGRTLARLPIIASSASEPRGLGGGLRRIRDLWLCG